MRATKRMRRPKPGSKAEITPVPFTAILLVTLTLAPPYSGTENSTVR
jgi:hypothetical protein